MTTIDASFKDELYILGLQLDGAASINVRGSSEFDINAKRWSEYAAPQPGAIVNVATESDVAKTVQWAVQNGVKFVAQNGGHGWTTKWNIGPNDIVINMRGLNNVTVDLLEGTAVIEGGALVHEVIEAAYENKVHIVVGNCNSVGACGAMLGGGFSRLQANFGMSIDNIISLRVVTAEGEIITVSETSNSDLLWGMKGAGHNFGIVTSAVVKAYPQINGGTHWEAMVFFFPDKIEAVTQAVNDLHLGEGMSIHYAFVGMPLPVICLELWYAGTPEEGEKAFESILSLGPIHKQMEPTPYNMINKVLDRGEYKGGRKPTFSVAIDKLDPHAAKKLWKLFAEFELKHPSAKDSVIMFECYGFDKVRQTPNDDSAFPWRDVNFHVCATLMYKDKHIDEDAEAFGNKFRDILRVSDGVRKKKVYVNYATGDETLEEIYGDEVRLERLRELKMKWDPYGRFNHYHPIH